MQNRNKMANANTMPALKQHLAVTPCRRRHSCALWCCHRNGCARLTRRARATWVRLAPTH